jgi:putative copper export protein/mono/diheme cytochrome c family protein
MLFAAMDYGPGDDRLRRSLTRLQLASLAVAAVGWLALVAGQTASFVGSGQPRAVLAGVQTVLRETAFGHVALAQVALLAAAAVCLSVARRSGARWAGAVLSLAAVGLQVGHLHAWAMQAGPGLLTASALLHVLGAAVWLGGLLPLRLLVARLSPALAAAAARRFSIVAATGVAMLAAGAIGQGFELLGGLPGVFGTSYGWTALVKAALFAALLGLAASNRFRLCPALARPDPSPARHALLRNIAVETWLGLAVVLAASLLGSLQPGMHAEPVWPFSVQPSLEQVRDDPMLAGKAAVAGLAVLVALALLIAMRGWRRWPALALLAVVAWFAAPRLQPLLMPALPTSFYTSPTGFAATSIMAGQALYGANCARCHGADGHGDGADAASLKLPPGDLTAAYLWDHSDGELFWWLTHGIDAPYGGLAMPGFAGSLDPDARWHLIDYLRAHNAGAARSGVILDPRPERAPDVAAECADGRSVGLPDLRGRLVRLVFQADAAPPPPAPDPPGIFVTTVLVPHGDVPSPKGYCVADDPAVPAAYAIATGLPADALEGREVVIDQNGWLREVTASGIDGVALANTLRGVAATPLATTGAPAHLHHHG